MPRDRRLYRRREFLLGPRHLASLTPNGVWTPIATGIGIAESGPAPNFQVTGIQTNAASIGARYFFRLRIEP